MPDGPNISICLTFKNRATYLDNFFLDLTNQRCNFNKVQICLADGGSSDAWLSIVHKWYKYFHSIKTAFCDRSELPFKVASNCPATDRNAMIANMPDAEKIIVTDPEVLFCDIHQVTNIQVNLKPQLLLHHKCYILPQGVRPAVIYSKTRPINFGGYCLCFNKSDFITNGGFDERYALGFAGEDSYFIWWWLHNRKAKQAAYPVMHTWHPSPSDNPEYAHLRKTYTLPLHKRLKKENAYPNKDVQDWTRPNTIKDVQLWQK